MSEVDKNKSEFGSNPEDIIVFNEMVATIKNHNEQFSLGTAMAKALLDHVDESVHIQELVKAGASQQEARQTVDFVDEDKISYTEEEEMARSIVGVINAPILEVVGLKLSPLHKTSTIISKKGEQSIGKVRLQLDDGSRFSNFLLSINPELQNDDFKQNIEEVVSNLIDETADAIANNKEDKTTNETLAYGKGILAGMERIGLDNLASYSKLRTLYDHAQKGDVKEYVLADKIGLLKEPGSNNYGPSSWQQDCTSEYLDTHWKMIVEILKETRTNPRAKDFFLHLLQSAQASLDYAKTDWVKLKSELGDNDKYGEGFDDVFETIGLELISLSSAEKEIE